MIKEKEIYDLAKKHAVLSGFDDRTNAVLWYSYEDVGNSLGDIAQRLQEMNLLSRNLCSATERVRQIRSKAICVLRRRLTELGLV
jgi:hypothetical protein